MGGGLGGGSTNAAAMLLALPAILKKKLPLEKLLELASELGSDVPFSCSVEPRLASDAAPNFIPYLTLPLAPA